jgi:oligogalacturonide lyase
MRYYVLLFSVMSFFSAGLTASDVGKTFQSEARSWIDPETGYEITQWTGDNGNNWHLYVYVNSFIDENNVVFFSDRNGYDNLYKIDLTDGEVTQLTDGEDIRYRTWHWPAQRKLWYISGKTLFEMNTDTFESRVVHTFNEIEPLSFTVTADAQWFVFSANKNPGFTENHSTGPYAIFKLDLERTEIVQISPDLGFIISHLQANPVDPTLISYCWQHRYRKGSPGIVGNTPQRIWWINIDGTDGGPVGVQEFGIHRTHEFWYPDGSRIGYAARYVYGPHTGEQFIGSSTYDGSDHYMIAAPVRFAHSQVLQGNRYWIADYYDGYNLVLFELGDREIVNTDILFEHGSSWEEQQSHPHPQFSPDGKYVLFTTDKSGISNLYTVTVNLTID